MLTTRLLPPEEWPRLMAFEPYQTKGLPGDPEDWRLLVVERDGEIVGTCALFTAVHWDNWWIAPELRGRGVLRTLLAVSLQLLMEAEVETVYTGAEYGDQSAEALLAKFGFRPAGGRLFVLDVGQAARAVGPPEKEASDGIAK